MSDVITVWPEEQKLLRTDEKTIMLTHFTDMSAQHASLINRIHTLEKDPAFCTGRFPGGCGIKVRDIAKWKHPAADVLNARALELFKRVTKSETAVVDESWASIYHTNDYCMPHSHLRAAGSIVYLLDPGDDTPDDAIGGKLCFADPRIACCCQVQPGHMTNLFMPTMQPGTMIIFPATAVHAVAPYTGKRPRITMSWNIAPAAIPGLPARLKSN